jgi:hypothetical protein
MNICSTIRRANDQAPDRIRPHETDDSEEAALQPANNREKNRVY